MFRELLGHELARSQRSQTNVAALLLDIDRFKEINESRGYKLGDQLLEMVAARLLQGLRKTDYVARSADGDRAPVARQGGDEFALMLTDLAQLDDAGLVARAPPAVPRPTNRVWVERRYLSPPASASRLPQTTAPMSTHCCKVPRPPCIAPSGRVETTFSSMPSR